MNKNRDIINKINNFFHEIPLVAYIIPYLMHLCSTSYLLYGEPHKYTHKEPLYDIIINKEFFEISLISKNLVKNLFLTSSIDSNFSDNYFDLIPNEEKLIKIKREKFKSINNFKEGLSFISLYDTY